MVKKTLLWTLAGVGAILIIIGLDLNFGITGYGDATSPLTEEQAFSRQNHLGLVRIVNHSGCASQWGYLL
ncbi:MAG: hypothetical protein KDE50_25115 [Caldilineaceae bacterium]|nr:hypothetical protein [Caldilineaceae bacterium]